MKNIIIEQSFSVSRETTDVTVNRVESMIAVALLHKFVYEFRGNNTYIILYRTALISTNERIESITGHMTYNPALQTTTTIHSRIFAKFQTCS